MPVLRYPEPELTHGRVRIRPWRESDLECVRAAATDPTIPRGTTVPSVFTEEAALAFVRRQWARLTDGQGVSQAIVEEVTGAAVGLVILQVRPQPRVAGLGYWIVPRARRAGFASSAVGLVTHWALTALELDRMEAWVDPGNKASQRTLTAAGFQREGRLRGFFASVDGANDALVYGFVGSDLGDRPIRDTGRLRRPQ